MNDKTILITGGTGSFGYQMTTRLLPMNCKVKIYSRDEDKHREMKAYFNSPNLSFMIGDLRDPERLMECFKNVDTVLHAGALKQITSVEFNPVEAIKTNTTSAYSIMKAADAQNVENVIAISTDKACKPINSYGMTKALMEKIITGDDVDSNTKFSCVRYGNVLGSRGSVLPVWDKLIQNKLAIPITSYEMRRFFLTLEQATDLILFAYNNMKGKEIFVRKAPAMLISDLAQVYAELVTGDSKYPQTEIGIRPGEKIDESLVSVEEMSHTKELDDYFRVDRPDSFCDSFPDEEYSSKTTNQLNRDQIKTLIEHLKWKK